MRRKFELGIWWVLQGGVWSPESLLKNTICKKNVGSGRTYRTYKTAKP